MALNKQVELIEGFEQIDDPMERVEAVHNAIDDRLAEVALLSVLRRTSIEEVLTTGLTQTQIAEKLGISRSRVSQLRTSGTKAERQFFGSGQVTIAIGAKSEQGRSDNAPKVVVSKEAMGAYILLSKTMQALGLETIEEHVPPPGHVDLNRSNLLVLCSPRLLPFIGQVLASDANLGFRHTDNGWILVDKNAGVEYPSPRDTGEHIDYGYVGRLPRPDGRGTFLYAAGIHAEGTLGAAQWLTENVHDLYKELKVNRFSTLVASHFADPNGVTVERITPIYRPESA